MNILLAEDDVLTRTLLATFLEENGFNILQVGTLIELKKVLQANIIDIAILDQTLEDGETIPAFFDMQPDPSIKVICITSNFDQKKKIEAVGTGIQSFLFKPINEEELLVRIQTLSDPLEDHTSFELSLDGKFILDISAECITGPSQQAKMTGTEIALLRTFAENTSQTFTREILSMKILERKWEPDDRSIDVLIGRIRKKMSGINCSSHINSVRGKGYRFEKL